MSLYLNGNLEATATLPESFVILDGEVTTTDSSIAENNADLVIGAYLDTFRDNISLSNHFSGVIDDVLVYKEALSQSQINEIYNGYVTPSDDYKIPFESQLLSFSDIVTVYLNNSTVSETIHIVPVDVDSLTPLPVQSISFADYVTYKVNGPVNDSSVEVMAFSDIVVVTLVPSNDTLVDSLSLSDTVVAIIPITDSIDDEIISESLSLNDIVNIKLNDINLVKLSEVLTLNDILSSSNYTIPEIDTLADIQLKHDTIEINKPVTWTHDVTFSNYTESVAVEIPADAEILVVKSLNNTSENIELILKPIIL